MCYLYAIYDNALTLEFQRKRSMSYDLEPEKRTSFDANIIYHANSNLAFSVNAYYGQISNLIRSSGYTTLSFHNIPVNFVQINGNSGNARTYGGTIRIDYKADLAKNLYSNLFIAYSFSDGEIAEKLLLATDLSNNETWLVWAFSLIK